jgi:rfaE bifunctional protein nucleotidyltransferase chain/domain
MNRLKSFKEISEISAHLKEKGKTIVFTNGCFDLIHIGHIRLLKKARALGDILIVGLNSDISAAALKGKNRPVLDEKARAEIMASFAMVDYIVIFSESTPAKLIGKIKPDIIVKGADYRENEVVGRKTVEKYGGKVFLFPTIKKYSTTGIINKIKQSRDEKQQG